MEKFQLTKAYLASLYARYTDSDLLHEYELVQCACGFLVTHNIDSHVYEFLDFIEPLILTEIVSRFRKSLLA